MKLSHGFLLKIWSSSTIVILLVVSHLKEMGCLTSSPLTFMMYPTIAEENFIVIACSNYSIMVGLQKIDNGCLTIVRDIVI